MESSIAHCPFPSILKFQNITHSPFTFHYSPFPVHFVSLRMTTKEAEIDLISRLKDIYAPGEAGSISDLVLENITGIKRPDRLSAKQILLTPEQEEKFHAITNRLLTHEPIQYVLNEAWFCGLKFYVDNNVLIPRPETEELVEWIISNCRFPVDALKILDIGSGSGCIPVSLKRRIRKAEVWGCDISDEALVVARRNADTLGTAIDFVQLDFLEAAQRKQLPAFDVIVSNPPYVPQKDSASMSRNVREYEPHRALFVPDNDPLIFYKAIAEFGKTHLHKEGSIYTEIHEDLGEKLLEMFRSAGYECEMKKDMQEKDRMIKAVRNVK